MCVCCMTIRPGFSHHFTRSKMGIPQEAKQQPSSVIRTRGVSLRPTEETLVVRRSLHGGTDDKHD